MSDEKKITNNEDLFLAELEAFRTGEEQDASKITPKDQQVIEDLNKISKLFSRARPDPDEIPETMDNVVLGHIREKSREIRRDRKIVRLFPRWERAAVAVMAILVCVVSFKLIFKSNISENNNFKDNVTSTSSEISKDIDGNGRIDIIDAYIMDRKLMSGAVMPQKLDLNGDGNIDHEDINTIVKTAVSLGRGEV